MKHDHVTRRLLRDAEMALVRAGDRIDAREEYQAAERLELALREVREVIASMDPAG